MSHTALCRVNFGATELILCHILSGYSLYNLGTGKEHIGYAFGHYSEVGKGGGVNGAAGTRTENA